MERYTLGARWYDAISLEPVYRAGRRRVVPALGLRPGDRVLDVGCGTGLNLDLLATAVGPTGQVVGVDRSEQMLAVARRKAAAYPTGNVRLVRADAEQLDATTLTRETGCEAPFDAVLFTYALSLMPNWREAWRRASSLVGPGGRGGVVDMEPPHGKARIYTPLARLACWAGGADIQARPWTALEELARDVQTWSLRGGHIQVRVGTL